MAYTWVQRKRINVYQKALEDSVAGAGGNIDSIVSYASLLATTRAAAQNDDDLPAEEKAQFLTDFAAQISKLRSRIESEVTPL